ncbi:MAG: TIR domain-containing protein [Pseudomonadota bacterium]
MVGETVFFLSHADKDKKRLEPIVLGLLDARIPLWIDKPTRITRDIRATQCGRIRYGNSWADDIEGAVQNTGSAVIVAWSRQAAKRIKEGSTDERGTLAWEMQYAHENRRLYLVRIDDVPFDELPEQYRQYHAVDLHDYDPRYAHPEWAPLLADLQHRLDLARQDADRANRQNVKSRMGRHMAGLHTGSRDRAFLPYQADRTVAFDSILKATKEVTVPGGANVQPAIIIGPENEVPDRFISRWKRRLENDLNTPVSKTNVVWNRQPDFRDTYISRFATSLLRRPGTLDEVRQFLADEARRGHVRVFVTDIYATQWDAQEHKRIREWVKLWNEFGKESPDALSAVPILCVWMAAAAPSWNGTPPTPKGQSVNNKKILNRLKKFTGETKLVPVLSPFAKEDAMDWRAQTIERFGQDTPLGRAVLSAFDEVFRNTDGRMTPVAMQTFADHLGDVLADEHID